MFKQIPTDYCFIIAPQLTVNCRYQTYFKTAKFDNEVRLALNKVRGKYY